MKLLTVAHLEDLTASQFADLRSLTVSERQEVLGKSFVESIDDWEAADSDQALGLCFLHEGRVVGMALFRRRGSQTASIHGLKIATPWQRKGFGHLAFQLALEELKNTWTETKRLELTVDAENVPAVTIYKAHGMSDSGPIFDGPNGKEHHMELAL